MAESADMHSTKSPRETAAAKGTCEPISAYLAHTMAGVSIRAIARTYGCHASTVLRQIRKTEQHRDDPLTDSAFEAMEALFAGRIIATTYAQWKDAAIMESWSKMEPEKLARESLKVLRALGEPGALLVIADGVEDAIVVKNGPDDRPLRRAVLTRTVAEYLAVQTFVKATTENPGRVARYAITSAGRGELSRLIAEAESARAKASGEDEEGKTPSRKTAKPSRRPVGADAPVVVLSRRKRGGEAYLTREMVVAAERFRENFEIAAMGSSLSQNWEALVQGRVGGGTITGRTEASVDRRRNATSSLTKAIRALGPELAECVILSCCHEEGMETIEDKLDYPARSGKIVLRIALATLARHYEKEGGEDFDLIY